MKWARIYIMCTWQVCPKYKSDSLGQQDPGPNGRRQLLCQLINRIGSLSLLSVAGRLSKHARERDITYLILGGIHTIGRRYIYFSILSVYVRDPGGWMLNRLHQSLMCVCAPLVSSSVKTRVYTAGCIDRRWPSMSERQP